MGFFANLAAKSEMKLRDQVLTCFEEFSNEIEMDIATGNVLLPCHIITEAHNGLFVQYDKETVGVFRCQNHWWLYELDEETVQGLRSPDSQKWMRKLSRHRPFDGGELQGGIQPFVASMLTMLKQVSEKAASDAAAKKAAKKEAKKLRKQAEIENRQRQFQLITNSVVYAAQLLNDSGCGMKVTNFEDTGPFYLAEEDIAFSLYFIEARGDRPLTLYADTQENCWHLADGWVSDGETATFSPIDKSSKTTAVTILQLIVERGFKNSEQSTVQKSWAQYIDSQLLPRMAEGIILELLTQSSDRIKEDTQAALDAMIAAYEYFPGNKHSLETLNKLRNL